MVTLIINAIGSAITGFASQLPTAFVSAFNGLFVDSSGTNPVLTNLAEGLLALAGIGLVIAVVVKIYHIFSGRVRKSM